MKKIAVFGSTGSIGVQTLNVVRRFPQVYRIVALTAGNNARLLAEQAAEFRPDIVAARKSLELPDGTRGVFGEDAAAKLAADCDADVYVMAISGLAALP